MMSFDKFVTDNKFLIDMLVPRSVCPDTVKYSMVIVEPRKHDNFEFVCKTMLRFTSDTWGLYVFHGTDNEVFVKDALKQVQNVIYINIQQSNLTTFDYNTLLTSQWFYEQIKTEVFIIFQTDSCLLQEGVDRFIGYDYIGAPWPHIGNQVGNGGFSLRTKSFCLDVCKRFPWKNGNEDVYFSTYAKQLKANLADYETAYAFSCENIKTNTLPLAVHKMIHNIQIPDFNKTFQENYLNKIVP